MVSYTHASKRPEHEWLPLATLVSVDANSYWILDYNEKKKKNIPCKYDYEKA